MNPKSYSDSKQVSIVMAVKDGLEITTQCLASLLPQNFKELIIVDNDSQAPTKKYLQRVTKQDSRVKIIWNSFNRGFAEANNQGLSLATGIFFLFFNNYTLVPDNFLLPLIDRLNRHDRTAAVQPIIIFPDKTIDSVGSYFTPTGFLYHKAHRQQLSYLNTQPSKVYSLKGACMLWKKEVLDVIGGFDDSYFAYFEESDLCHRAWNAGWDLEFLPDSFIVHYGGFTSNQMPSSLVQFHNTKNRFTTYFRHVQLGSLFWLMIWHLPLSIIQALLAGLKNPGAGWAQIKGIGAGLVIGTMARLQTQQNHRWLEPVTKRPSADYYLALLNSLKNYRKIF